MLVAVMNYKRTPEQHALEGAGQIYQYKYHGREVILMNGQDSAHKFGVGIYKIVKIKIST